MTDERDFKLLVDEFVKRPLSDASVAKMLDGRSRVILYNQLAKYRNLEDVFGPDGSFVVLYQTSKNFGHWACVFKRSRNKIEIFDSLGYYPDNELKFVPTDLFKGKLLTNLVTRGGYNVVYNPYRLQKDNDTNTCGKWCVVRLKLRDKTLTEFVKIFTNKYAKEVGDPDFIVSTLFYMYETGLLK